MTPLHAYTVLQYVWNLSLTAVKILIKICEKVLADHFAEPAM